MRQLTALLLSMVSLHAESMGVNATKLPPARKGSAVSRTPPTMKMPATKQNAKTANKAIAYFLIVVFLLAL